MRAQGKVLVYWYGFEDKFVRHSDTLDAFVDGQGLLKHIFKIPDISISIIVEAQDVFEVAYDLGAKYDHFINMHQRRSSKSAFYTFFGWFGGFCFVCG